MPYPVFILGILGRTTPSRDERQFVSIAQAVCFRYNENQNDGAADPNAPTIMCGIAMKEAHVAGVGLPDDPLQAMPLRDVRGPSPTMHPIIPVGVGVPDDPLQAMPLRDVRGPSPTTHPIIPVGVGVPDDPLQAVPSQSLTAHVRYPIGNRQWQFIRAYKRRNPLGR